MSDLATLPSLDRTGTDDPDNVAHVVWPDGQARVTEARVMGTPVVALCGYEWVPSLDPIGMAVCSSCAEIMHRMTSDAPSAA